MVKKDTKKKAADIRERITFPTQVYRIRTGLDLYRTAVVSAENLITPQRYNYYQIGEAVILDAHVSAALQQLKNLILGREFVVLNPDGEENEEKTKLIKTKWFRDYLNLVMDQPFWGHSLIQFDSIIDMNGQMEFKCVELVPRIYVKPEFHIVTKDYGSFKGEDYLEDPWNKWTIGVGGPRDLGLLLKIAPLQIWKKNALGAWAEFVEKFGTPARIGKTNARDKTTRDNMFDTLRNMGVSFQAVIDKDDEIEYVESKTQDAFQVFDMMIQRCNSEISKLILGQTSTLEEKAFVGSAEVHERVLQSYSDMYEKLVDGVNNYQLIPLLNSHGFGMEGMRIACQDEDEWTLEQKGKFDVELLKTGKFTMTPEYIKDKYGSEVIEAQEPDNNIKEVKNRLDEYYN